LNTNLYVNNDLSLNGNLYVSKRSVFTLDASFNGNVKLGSGNRTVAINKDISSAFALDVSGLTILRNRLFVTSDVSLNANLYVNNDLSLNGNLYVVKRSVFTLDASFNGNTKLGTGSSSVAINKDISSAFALDVSGTTKLRGDMDVTGVFTVNGLPVFGSSESGTALLTGNVQVGSDSGFVTIDKPYFFADPSLTIYYNFDATINEGTEIKNMATTSTLYDGLLNVNGSNTNSMIDTTVKKFGASSLKNNPNATNNGVTICNNSVPTTFPVSSSMSFSFWVYKPQTPLSTTFDRIFEISDLVSPGGDNNTIALDINSSGVVLPVLTYAGDATPCINTISSPIIPYNVCNGVWNHIAWTITPTNSYIYINGSNNQIDIINNPVPITARKSAFVSYLLNNVGTRDFSGNIDDFRYYNGKALSYAEIYQLYNNNFYTFDICGGFLANGSSVIYEPVGSKASANSGTLTLLHGDASGSSSIMFKSLNDPLEYGYIQYEENAVGSTGFHYGLLTIGIENDAGSGAYTAQADRVSLFPSGGTGFVGINTKMPQTSLDVSGQMQATGPSGTILTLKNTAGPTASAPNELNIDFYINTGSSYRPGRIACNHLLTGGGLWYSSLSQYVFWDQTAILGMSMTAKSATASNCVSAIINGDLTTGADISINGVNIGRGAGNLVTNTAVGYQALSTNTSGYSNVAIGYQALSKNSTGNSNVAIGYQSLVNSIPTTTTGYNTAVGYNTLSNVTTGSNNVAIGVNAGGTNAQTASNNTFLGGNTIMSATNWTTSTAVGYGAEITASNQIKLGTTSQNVICGSNLLLQGDGTNSYIRSTTGTLYLGGGNSNVLSLSNGGATLADQIQIFQYSDNKFYIKPLSYNLILGGANANTMEVLSTGITVTGVTTSTSFNANSDYRVKENVVPLDESFTIDGLNPVTYNLKSTGRQDIGFIAHEVQEFYPLLVSGEKDGKDTQSLNYNGLIGILTKEIKVLKKKEANALAKAVEQEARIADQEARIQALEKMMLDLINK